MRPGLGVAHSDQLAQHGYGGVHSVSAFITSGEASKKVYVLKDVEDFVCKWYPIKLGSGSARGFTLACDQVFYF